MDFHHDTDWPPGSGPYRTMIRDAADRHGVPVMLLAWLLWQESRYRPDVINGSTTSPAGAMGIAQFMPATAREWLERADNALDPSRAIPGAARYLYWLYTRTGNWPDALAAYNWGIGNVLNKGRQAAPAETRAYVDAILRRSGYAQYI